MSNKNIDYDKSIKEVEQIISKLQNQNEQYPFDEIISEVERAVNLLNDCKTKLVSAEERLNKLFESTDEEK